MVETDVIQAVRKDGIPRTRTECDRGGQTWHAREVLVPKNSDWMDEIAREVVKVLFYSIYRSTQFFIFKCVEMRDVPDVDLPTGEDIPKNQSKVPKPSKEDLLLKQQTRLKLGNK